MKRNLEEIHADVLKEQREAATNPNHPMNLKIQAFLVERRKKLNEIKKQEIKQ